MHEKKKTKFKIKSYDEEDEKIEITIEGNSSMPFWHHDLKFEAAIALLHTVDEKDFDEDGIRDKYYEYVDQIKEVLNIEDLY